MMIMSIELNAVVITEKNKVQQLHKIQKIYKHKLRRHCKYGAAYFAQQHTKKEWASFDNQSFKGEVDNLCPKGKGRLRSSEISLLHLFAIEYANDSGTYPRS